MGDLWARGEGVLIQPEHLVFIFDQLVRLAYLEGLDRLCEGVSEDLAAVRGSSLSIKGVSYPSIRNGGDGRVLDVFVGR